ncbi:hypothetical protein DFH07DRAFT_910197 [Mycena maculata]|uniref:Uncharacterized protein n=1 Tax=Mycena maculata TaxID=230809 RepID=A0AAD7NYV3_9AGAR|nr:hypothetical protein DFH07DRAFT_910197 [Mycena maculata]
MSAQLAQNLAEYLAGDDVPDSDDESEERSQLDNSSDSDNGEPLDLAKILSNPLPDSEVPYVHGRKTRQVDPEATNSPWFPWPDKETCVLDILRHIPRCSFSKKQNAAIHWAMLALGVEDLPSDRVMDDIDKALQKMCGIQSIRYSGKLGHVYYVNDLAAIIAQEMANPTTRKNLHFFPEDTKPSLSQAWQASRWLDELEPDLTTPMTRVGTQDFYIHEPTLLSNGTACMPIRWFKRGGKTLARAWKMHEVSGTDPASGWVIEGDKEIEVQESELLISFPTFVSTYSSRKKADPRIIQGIYFHHSLISTHSHSSGIECQGKIEAWTKTSPVKGNRWRELSAGHRVLAFPIWLYCDDTSGNTSKRWNKHNSFLFTAAGLPRKFVHRESNVHFLSTSNVAPPLEMLDGIVEQLEACQKHGIWAWDAQEKELVLVIPSVLAMLGDNPMQSEFACHIGFKGRFFCRVCWVKGDPDVEDEEENDDGDASDTSISSQKSSGEGPAKKKKKTKKKNESVNEMISRVTQFMSPGQSRTREESCAELRTQFTVASAVGGQAGFKRRKTESGIKDTFQGVFLERIFAISSKRGRNKNDKQTDVNRLLRTFPPNITSPVWRIKDLDPHRDTPVEILHVILLGFVKYFWRDAVTQIKKSDKELLITRLSSFNVSGLGVSPLAGATLVNYAGSLTGRDFRIIVQAAPFVLQGLLPASYIELWTSLSAVVTLVWQPHIPDLDKYIVELDAAIKHFLDCTCGLTLQWFNKPKFHVILHLPAHIRRFGPAMLFATEGFESFNAIIRSASVHSNRHAPSLDIASRMAKGNRVRHLLSRGFFPSDQNIQPTLPNNSCSSQSPWMAISLLDLERCRWNQAGNSPLQFLGLNSFGSRLLGWENNSSREVLPVSKVFTPETVTLINGDACSAGDWVVWVECTGRMEISRIGCVAEIIQVAGSAAQREGKADFLLLSRTIIGESHNVYKMRRLQPIPNEYCHVQIKDIKCTVNIQHNCADNKCRTTRTRVILNEREKTSERGLEVEHLSKSDLIINTAQMRDAAALNAFRWKPSPLVTANIIQLAAEKAHSDRQKQKKSTATGELEPGSPDLEPAPKRSRLDPAASQTSSSPGASNSRVPSARQTSTRRIQTPDRETQNSTGFSVAPARSFHFSNTFQSSFPSDQ